MPNRSLPLMIVGWSARAAAQSARRGGCRVTAIDVFQDADLQWAADVCVRVPNLREIATSAAELPPSAWLYTGGIENHPAFVKRMGKRHGLLGNDADVLRRVRDPQVLQRSLASGPAPMPEMSRAGDDGVGCEYLAAESGWLLKQRRSGGGVRVTPWTAGERVPRGAYRQRFVPGTPWGASYLAAGGRCLLLGVCRQLPAMVDPARPFLYGGSIGPIPLEPAVRAKLTMLGEQLTAEFGLRGLMGVDLIAQPDGTLRTLEVNPRYTASMELLERAAGRSLISLHIDACLENRLPAPFPNAEALHGKRIVYVDETFPQEISAALADRLLASAGEESFPLFADLPAAATKPQPGDPFCTVFASAATESEVERRLGQSELQLRSLLRQPALVEKSGPS